MHNNRYINNKCIILVLNTSVASKNVARFVNKIQFVAPSNKTFSLTITYFVNYVDYDSFWEG